MQRFTVNMDRLSEFAANVVSTNKRIERLFGIRDDISFVITGYRTVEVNMACPIDPDQIIKVEVHVADIDARGTFMGEEIRLDGWKFCGSVSYTKGQSEGVFSTAPGGISQEMRDRLTPVKAHVCDHCNRRVYRNRMVIVADQDGKEVAVGSSCVSDFIGRDVPADFLNLALLKQVWDRDFEVGPPANPNDYAVDLIDYLLVVKYIIAAEGGRCLGRNYEGDKLTTGEVLNNTYSVYTKKRWYSPEEILERHSTEEDLEVVRKAIEHSKAEAASGNDFHQNLGVYIRDMYVNNPSNSMAFWILGSYVNKLFKEAASGRPEPKNEYFGSVGDKLKDFDLELVFKTWSHNQWGTTFIYKFIDCEGRAYTNMSGKCLGRMVNGDFMEYEVGSKFTTSFKIMEHEEYQGQLQTRIGYAKFTPLEV